MKNGVEYCPFCECDFEFEVTDEEWFTNCPTCGRPTLLCDSCEDHTKCSECKFTEMSISKQLEWEISQIGRVVWFNDKEDEVCSGWYRIINFNKNGGYVLEHIERGTIVLEFGLNIDFEKTYDWSIDN